MTMNTTSSTTARAELVNEMAEQAVLSALLLDPGIVSETRVVLEPDAFARPAHRTIYNAMLRLVDAGSLIDPLTLSSSLASHSELERSGGMEYVGYLVDVVPTAANWTHHASIVRDLHERRSVIRSAEALIAAVSDKSVSVASAAQEATSALLPSAASMQRGGFVAVADLMYDVARDIEDASSGKMAGLSWGFREMDRQTGGIMPGELAFFCSVPGGCKTALALNIALAAAERGEGVGFVSAEMKDRALVKRLLSNRAQVSGYAIRTGNIQDGEYVRLGATLGSLSHLPLWIDDTPEPDIDVIKARARALKAKHPELRWMMVDFIQLVVSGQDSDDGRARELSRIAYALAGLAKELDVAVVATCQVDAAGIEKRGDKRPQLGDMQWSQAMRQAGHFVALMYRQAMYNDSAEDVIEVDFRKARELEPFKVTLDWMGKYMRVEDQFRPRAVA